MEQVLNELSSLCLDALDEDWVQAIYHSEFLEIADLPADYESALESITIPKVFQNLIKCISMWLNAESDEEEDKSWAALSSKVQHQRLLTVLAYYIDHGTKNVHTKEYRNNALLASRVYYTLLSIPGYKAYHIYHAQLFTHSLACLSFPKEMCEKDDNYYNTKELTREVNSVIRELRPYVLDLRSVIEKLQLKPTDMNFEDILSNLVDITGGAIVNKFNIDKIELANISRVIYAMIDSLLQEADGEPSAAAIQLLFKCLLPKLVAASVDSRNANNLVRASYVTYSGLLLTKYGKAAVSGFSILLQHLCYTQDGLERAEVRAARVQLVVGLMSLLPRRAYRAIVRWLLQLSDTAKVAHRHIAMELLANLLSNDPEEVAEQPTTEVPPSTLEGQPEAKGGEGDNETPTEKSANNEDEGNPDAQEAAVSMDSTDTESSQELPGGDPAKEQEFEGGEDEVAGLLRARAHTVPYGALLAALAARAQDASGTLRARALAMLADVTAARRPAMQQALKELNAGGAVSRLVALAAQCAGDERAAVRRAALLLLARCLAADEAALTRTNLAVLTSLCRDASIQVRSAAIAALADLVTQWGRVPVLDAFLAGPMHQLSDPETKVQEQLVTLVQQILVDRLRARGAGEDPLPWAFLAAAARHDMRRHLQKACALMAKSTSCISHRLIDVLSSHLCATDAGATDSGATDSGATDSGATDSGATDSGATDSGADAGAAGAQRELSALLLLSCAAPHVAYTEPGFVLDYYYRLMAEDPERARGRDARALVLTLQLLTTWSRFLEAGARADLRAHLIRALGTADWGADSCRLECAVLAAHLDPQNLQWATELMQIYENRALEGGGVEECLAAADMSLVAPLPPRPALLQRLLDTLQQPPAAAAESEAEGAAAEAEARGCCVAALGRLCVRARAAGAAAAPALARVLFAPTEPIAARVNALLALIDICTRYTCIVEPLLGSVCACFALQSPPPLRRAAAAGLTRLLLGGFLRLRTPLYYRYCALLADEDPDVREPAEYYVTCCLTADAIYHHFVDCVLHYNCDDTESITFDARQLIYDVMLQRLSLVQKLNVQCRLAREVLAHAADTCDELPDGAELPAALHAALLDTITLLCGPRMKLPRKPQSTGDGNDIDDLQERVTTNIVSHKMKRTVAEVLVPAVLRLSARLRHRGGQLNVYLVRIATDLLKDYRQEIEELIENDEELVERVRQFQETIGEEPSFGNSRNLVTASTAHEPETPRARRRPVARSPRAGPPAKRALRV